MKDDRRRSITFTVDCFEFRPGDVVERTSGRSSLPEGRFIVTRFVPPSEYNENGILFVEGEKYGIDAEYVKLVGEGE